MDLKFWVFGTKMGLWVKVTESGSVFLGPLGVHTCIGFVFVH